VSIRSGASAERRTLTVEALTLHASDHGGTLPRCRYENQ